MFCKIDSVKHVVVETTLGIGLSAILAPIISAMAFLVSYIN